MQTSVHYLFSQCKFVDERVCTLRDCAGNGRVTVSLHLLSFLPLLSLPVEMELGEDRNDEERIIENMMLDGRTALYEDLDFLPTRQSLYNSEKQIPEYDDEVFQRVT